MTISATVQGIRPGVCTSTSRPSTPFDGQVIYETDTNTLAVYDGSGWVSLNPVDRDRNVVINGAMQVAQRGTSVTGITTAGYRTADRFQFEVYTQGTWTNSVENDAPTGSGFRKSFKLTCTTADASPAAGDAVLVSTQLEGQNVQKFKKGTSSAERFTLSFWVKGTTTGTYIAELVDNDNTRAVSASYSISVANTWEKKTITFPADTTGAFDNDNASSLALIFWLGAGSNFTSGTLSTSWTSTTNANRAVGQANLAAATNNYWQVTGVQLEVGAVATPFEFEDYATTLMKCQRYAFNFGASAGKVAFNGLMRGTTAADVAVILPVQMRAAPTAPAATTGSKFTVFATGDTNADFSGNIYDANNVSFVARFTPNTALTAGIAVMVISATTNTPLIFSAEL